MSIDFDFKRAANLLRQCRARKMRREFMRRNRAADRPYQSEYARNQRKINPQKLIKEKFHRGMRAILANEWVSRYVLEWTQATPEEIRSHFEKHFLLGMAWSNRGGQHGWQVDCIKPCQNFDLTKHDHRQACFALSNLRPVWPLLNRTKDRPVK